MTKRTLALLQLFVVFASASLASAAPVDPAAPTLTAPPPVLLLPYTGLALFETTNSPNCQWTCNSGSKGAQNVSSEDACRRACNLSCGQSCWML